MTRYSFSQNDEFVGAYCIEAIPNQPQVAHCHSFFIAHDKRGKKFGSAMKVDQCKKLRELGFNYATCTTRADNAAQAAVLTRCGWTPISRFGNSNTGGETVLWGWEVV
jgi:RimJ/RimL family protein N-acetyltransferase